MHHESRACPRETGIPACFLQVYWRLPNIPSNIVLSGKIGRSVWYTIHYHLPIGSWMGECAIDQPITGKRTSMIPKYSTQRDRKVRSLDIMGKTSSNYLSIYFWPVLQISSVGFVSTSGYLPFADDLDDPTEVCTAVLKDWSSRIFLDGNCQRGRPQGCQKIPYFRRFFLELYGSAFWKNVGQPSSWAIVLQHQSRRVSESGGSTAVPIEFQGCHSAEKGSGSPKLPKVHGWSYFYCRG